MTDIASDNKADIICGCSGTTVGQILALIEQGTIDMDRISRITGVLSGCGGCEFDVQALVNNHKDSA